MSEAAAAAPPAGAKKGGGKKKLIVMVVGALVLIGAGVGAGMFAAGSGLAGGGAHAEEKKEDPDQPKLVAKEGGDHGGSGAPEHAGEDGKFDPNDYKATYYEMDQPFTSNLRDADGFMQVGLGLSTYYDQRVIDRIEEHKVAIRSAILMTLADQDSFVVSTPEGKKELQKELKDAVNGVLKKKTGFGGIDDVYFTSFIIQ